MPSKGQSSRGPAQPLAEVLAAAIGPDAARGPVAAATAAPSPLEDLEESLHRGQEIDRFNELAARQDSLTTEESDELYGYRIRRVLTIGRRMGRSLHSREQDLREALDEYRRRLRSLRAFEEIRESAGLFAGQEIDAAIEEGAVTRLGFLEEARPHGLVAGSGEQPLSEPGAVRVAAHAFAPRSDDVPVVILAPETTPHEQLSAHVDELRGLGANVRLVTSPSEIAGDGPPPLVINWGSDRPLPQGVVALNRPEAVRTAADQVECLRRLAELAPRTVLNPQDLDLLGSERVVAKRRTGMQGRGKSVIAVGADPAQRAGYDVFQEFIPERREYRVTLNSNRVVSAHLKRPPEGAGAEDLRPGWSYERLDSIPKSVARVAREAATRIGLDLAGVDVIEDLRTGRVLCLEANSAPGMSADTLQSLYSGVQRMVRGRMDAAA